MLLLVYFVLNLESHYYSAGRSLQHVLSSVAGWFTLLLFRAVQLLQHLVASSSFWAPLGRCWLSSCEGDQKGA